MSNRPSVAQIYRFGNRLEELCEKYGLELGFCSNTETGFFDFTGYGGFKSLNRGAVKTGAFVVHNQMGEGEDWFIDTCNILELKGSLEERVLQYVLDTSFTGDL